MKPKTAQEKAMLPQMKKEMSGKINKEMMSKPKKKLKKSKKKFNLFAMIGKKKKK